MILLKLVVAFAIGCLLLIGMSCAVTVSQESSVITEEKSHSIALDYLRNSPTFKFDGIENTLKLVSTAALGKLYSWRFDYEFQCRHAGYGDRSGQILLQVITFHKAQIVVEKGEVAYAVLDGKWNMLRQKAVRQD
jgi:hypothetical protein